MHLLRERLQLAQVAHVRPLRPALGQLGRGLIALAALLATGAGAPPQEPDRPSILLLVADDLGLLGPGCYGPPKAPSATPRVDELARQGLRFTRAYAVTAHCTPSRAALLTGLHPHSSGATGYRPLDEGVPTLPELLARSGYRVGALGKLHVEPEPAWDARVPTEELGRGRDPAAFGRAAAEFLAADDGRPWFLWVGFSDPHRPWPEAGPDEAASVEVPPWLVDAPAVRAELAAHRRAVQRLDEAVGQVLDALAEAGGTDDALVVLTSDHGPGLPFAKGTLLEAGLRVPLVVRWPGRVPAGSVAGSCVGLVDLAPTLLEAAGAAPPGGLEGRPLAAELRGEAVAHDEAFASTTLVHGGAELPARSIRVGRWKLVRNFLPERAARGAAMHTPSFGAVLERAELDPALAERCRRLYERQEEQLYDLEEDPWELVDRSRDPDLEATREHLRTALRARMRALDDPWLAAWPR